MGPSAIQIATAPNYSTTFGGTSISFTPVAGGSAIPAKIVYTLAGQVAGLLPSSIAPGTYAVRVTYNGLTSAPQNVTVVARSFGIAAAILGGAVGEPGVLLHPRAIGVERVGEQDDVGGKIEYALAREQLNGADRLGQVVDLDR